jgi:hypothetical protein
VNRSLQPALLAAGLLLLYLAGARLLIDRRAPIYRILAVHPLGPGQRLSAEAIGYHLHLGDNRLGQVVTWPVQWLLLLEDGPVLAVNDLYFGEQIDPALHEALSVHLGRLP